MSNNNTGQDPLWLQRWKEEGIRYLGKKGTGHIDHLDRWQQAFMIGFLEGVKSCAEEFELPPGTHFAAVELINEEEVE
jgi:hypothetical protein